MTKQALPTGFEAILRSSPFTDLLKPIYSRQDDKSLVLGMHCEQKHCNARGLMHGGVLCSLADIALGYNCALQGQNPSGMVTTNLTIDFCGSVKPGDWIEVEVDVQKVGGTLAFANCYFRVAAKRIARASAIFCKPRSS